MANKDCPKCHGRPLVKCGGCGVTYAYTNKYSSCNTAYCVGGRSEDVTCPECGKVDTPLEGMAKVAMQVGTIAHDRGRLRMHGQAPSHADAVAACRQAIESAKQAEFDLVGDQRAWHLPRLRAVAGFMMVAYPLAWVEALASARDPDGDSFV